MHCRVCRQSLGQSEAGLATTQHHATCNWFVSTPSKRSSQAGYRFPRKYPSLISRGGDNPFSLVRATALGIMIRLARERPRGE